VITQREADKLLPHQLIWPPVLFNNLAMLRIDVEEIRKNLSVYLQRVETGETLIITRGDKAVAEIKPIAHTAKVLRPYGLCAGEFTVPDDFDEPLPEDSLAEFEGR
jgi:antitoxin (DNA-binding transcriptional repressor) of toxin-antitoxin stability system